MLSFFFALVARGLAASSSFTFFTLLPTLPTQPLAEPGPVPSERGGGVTTRDQRSRRVG